MIFNWTTLRFIKSLKLVVILALFWSCEEKINVNLKGGSPQVVIESFITNSKNPIMVKLSRSQDFFNQNSFTPIEHAVVQIESLTDKDQLVEDGAGYYSTSMTKGLPGRTYTLKILTGSERFNASVRLPYPVPIDTIYFHSGLFQKDSLNAIVEFIDPADTENFYRIKLYYNRHYATNDYILLTDAFSEGKKTVVSIYSHNLAPGDTIADELLNLERNTWRYLKGLSESIQQGVNSQAPGNPPSNFSNGALGIFGAYSSSVWLGIVPGTSGKATLNPH